MLNPGSISDELMPYQVAMLKTMDASLRGIRNLIEFTPDTVAQVSNGQNVSPLQLEELMELMTNYSDINHRPAIKAPVTQARIDTMCERKTDQQLLADILAKAKRHL